MAKKLLSFEFSQERDSLELHMNKEGLSSLIDMLNNAQQHGDHVHLMTQSWGGSELTEEKQGVNNTLINHVKVMLWK